MNSALADIQYDGDETEIAYLCFAMGIKTEMGYTSWTSGTTATAEQFRKIGFESAVNAYSWKKYRQNAIENIKLGFPVDLGLTNNAEGEGGGHMVVMDGYIEDLELFHINMGWMETSISGMSARRSIRDMISR